MVCGSDIGWSGWSGVCKDSERWFETDGEGVIVIAVIRRVEALVSQAKIQDDK